MAQLAMITTNNNRRYVPNGSSNTISTPRNVNGNRNRRELDGARRKKRHLMEGEVFIYNGVEFRVMACEPNDGFVTQDTPCHISGKAIDLKSMTIRPLSETSPNRHKNLGLPEIKKIYLDPYFKGRSRYVNRGYKAEVSISGVDFAIIESIPRAGIITCSTRITQKEPMNADDLRERQEEQDMALARRLQQEEDQRRGTNLGSVQGRLGQALQENKDKSGASFDADNSTLFPPPDVCCTFYIESMRKMKRNENKTNREQKYLTRK